MHSGPEVFPMSDYADVSGRNRGRPCRRAPEGCPRSFSLLALLAQFRTALQLSDSRFAVLESDEEAIPVAFMMWRTQQQVEGKWSQIPAQRSRTSSDDAGTAGSPGESGHSGHVPHVLGARSG